jgi:ankyrin repeat protein
VKDGLTALHMAAVHGFVELCQFFLDKGVDPNIQNNVRSSSIDRTDVGSSIILLYTSLVSRIHGFTYMIVDSVSAQ